MSFEKILSHSSIFEFLKETQLKEPTTIQKTVIPEILKGFSVDVVAKTGSGKTLAFVLPIVELVKSLEEEHGLLTGKEHQGKPLTVVLAPTRELASQIYRVFKTVSHHAKIRIRKLEGGEGLKTVNLLKRECFEILIATPGKLSQALKSKSIDLSNVHYLVLDEADQLLDLGFKKDIKALYEGMDKTLGRVLLFSATSSTKVDELKEEIFTEVDFHHFNKEDKNKLGHSIRAFNIYIRDEEKFKMTLAFVDNQAKGKGIIFVNKHQTADQLKLDLEKKSKKYKFVVLHGEMEPLKRKQALKEFLEKDRILIATDIAARGMDIADLLWVLNYDLPFEAIYYIHRMGRVGRNHKDGFAYNLITPRDQKIVARINEAIVNQTALKLTVFDEKRFKVHNQKKAEHATATKLEKKKAMVSELKKMIAQKELLKKKNRPYKDAGIKKLSRKLKK